MESIVEYCNSLGLDFYAMLKAGGILLAGLLVTGLLGRFVFGKRSNISCAVSSAIAILCMYAVVVGLKYAGPKFESFIAPLPFVTVRGDMMYLFDFTGTEYLTICAELLSMIILAFLVNVIDRWLPKRTNIFAWLFFRCLTVILALFSHLIVSALLLRYLPEGVIEYAPMVLLALLVLMLLTGALKLLVGVVISTVNPVIAGLYTFFFASLVGKMITRAVLTTALLSALVLLLEYVGITAVSIAAAVLTAYIPMLVLLVIIWYVVNRVL